MSDTQTTTSGGIGFFGLLGIVFITLKLTGYIDWSWWLLFGLCDDRSDERRAREERT